MIGGIIGDVLGSVYEAHQWSTKNLPLINTQPVADIKEIVPLFKELKWVRKTQCWTDDTLCTLALYDTYLNHLEPTAGLASFCKQYAHDDVGFGKNFEAWLHNPVPGGKSYGNGAIMRLGFIPHLDLTLPEKLRLAHEYTNISHDHPDSHIAVDEFINICEQLITSKNKECLKSYLLKYEITETVESYHEKFAFELNAKKTLDQAVVILNESDSFDDVMKNCFYVGGDSDTLACIAGNMAELIYAIPEYLRNLAMTAVSDQQEFVELINTLNDAKLKPNSSIYGM